MKKNIFIILVCSIIWGVNLTDAQESSLKVGIMDFTSADENRNDQKLVSSVLSAGMGRYSFISLVERSQLGSLIKEIELSETGLLDEKTIIRAGKVFGLQVIVDGSISKSGSISARAIYSETARVIATGAVASKNDLDTLAKMLASGIETYIARENLKKLRNDSPDISLNLWLEKKDGTKLAAAGQNGSAKIGTSVVFHFSSNMDGYITIVDIQPGGDIVVLYPNDFSGSNEINKNEQYAVPSADDGFEITVSEPAGEDTLVAFFTKKKVDWLDMKKLSGDGFKSIREGEKVMASRGFNVTATSLKKKEWESVEMTLQVGK